MRNLTKLMLASAVMVTSGFAAEGTTSQYNGGNLIVQGTLTQISPATVDGLIKIEGGGVFENKTTLTFGESGKLSVNGVESLNLEFYNSLNAEYNLNVCPVGYYEAGKMYAVNGQVMNDYSGELMFMEDYGGVYSLVYDDTSRKPMVTNLEPVEKTSEFVSVKIKFSVTGGGYRSQELILNGDVQNEDGFIAAVKSAIESSEAPDDVKALSAKGETEPGTFDNSGGVLDFTGVGANGTFSGEISGGTIKLGENTNDVLQNLKINEGTVLFTYDSSKYYSAPEVVDGYIEVTVSSGMDATEAKKECGTRFDPESNYTFSGEATGTTTDDRKSFVDLLNDGSLNISDNKLKTNELDNVVAGYEAVKGLAVSKPLNIQLEGTNDLLFATGEVVDGVNVVTFAGSQESYSGVASFGNEVKKVVASVENALPKKLAESMSNITLEVSENNSIDHNGKNITIKNLILNSGDFVIAKGTHLTVGVTPQ